MSILTREECLSAIKSCGNRAKSLNNDLQAVALSVILHANQHGDVTLAQAACEAFTKGQRLNSFVVFLEKYGKLQWDKKARTVVYRKRDDVAMDEEKLLEVVGDSRWYTAVAPEQPVSIVDVQTAFLKFMERIERQAGEAAEVHHKELLPVLEELKTKLTA